MRLIILYAILLVLLVGAFYFYPKADNRTITSTLGDITESLLSSSTVDVVMTSLNEEYSVNLKRGETAILSGEEISTRVRLLNLNKDKNLAAIRVSDYGDIILSINKESKIDSNNDGYFDLIISLNSLDDFQASIFFMPIKEKKDVFDDVGNQFNKVVENIEQRSRLQSYLIFALFIAMILILLLYIAKAYIIPEIQMKKKKERTDPLETLDFMLDEVKELKEKGETEKARKIYSRAKHMQDYLEEKEQKKAEKKITEMQKYIN